jgi:dienelactone hydrolase
MFVLCLLWATLIHFCAGQDDSSSMCVMSVCEERVEYKDGDEVLEGFLAKPSGTINTKLPAIIINHAFAGLGHFEEGRARELAKLGFVAFAADNYGKGKRGKSMEENRALMQPHLNDRTGLLRKRLLSALSQVKSYDFVDANRIGVIGYCFGGLCALDLARINAEGVKVAVSFHGSLTPLTDKPEGPISPSVLVCHGDADTHIPSEHYLNFMAEMRDRHADWQFVNYGNAKHAFTEPSLINSTIPGVGYNEKAAHRSWTAMLNIFNEVLQHPKPQ